MTVVYAMCEPLRCDSINSGLVSFNKSKVQYGDNGESFQIGLEQSKLYKNLLDQCAIRKAAKEFYSHPENVGKPLNLCMTCSCPLCRPSC